MKSFKIEIANQVVEIRTSYDLSCDFFKDFLTDKPYNCRIEVLKDCFIEKAERNSSLSTFKEEVSCYSIRPLWLWLISEKLIEYNAFLMHGAAIALENESYIFIAPSGIGKTTHIQKWLEHCPNAFVINGDKPFVLVDEEDGCTIKACGSPWGGKEHLYSNAIVPLKAIIIMERGEENIMKRISMTDAFPLLLQQIYRPVDADKMKKTLKLLLKLNGKVTFWHFQCNNFKDDCLQVSYKALHE